MRGGCRRWGTHARVWRTSSWLYCWHVSVLPSRGLLGSGVHEKGVVVHLLGSLPVTVAVSKPTGLHMGVNVVDATCLTPCTTGCAVHVCCVRRYLVYGERGRRHQCTPAVVDVQCLCKHLC